MTAYFNKVGWPEKAPSLTSQAKNRIVYGTYGEIVVTSSTRGCQVHRSGSGQWRVKVAVCSTSNEKGDPTGQNKSRYMQERLFPTKNLIRCVVIEDSAIGLAAAKAAGMKYIVTKSGYTADEDFLNADAVFDCIVDPPVERFIILWKPS